MPLATRWIVIAWALGAYVLTVQRVTVWHSELALWQDAQRHAPSKVRPALNLGRAYLVSGDAEWASLWFHHAARLSGNPQRTAYERRYGAAYAQSNLAVLDAWHGHEERARLRLRLVLQTTPDFQSARALCASVGC